MTLFFHMLLCSSLKIMFRRSAEWIPHSELSLSFLVSKRTHHPKMSIHGKYMNIKAGTCHFIFEMCLPKKSFTRCQKSNNPKGEHSNSLNSTRTSSVPCDYGRRGEVSTKRTSKSVSHYLYQASSRGGGSWWEQLSRLDSGALNQG